MNATWTKVVAVLTQVSGVLTGLTGVFGPKWAVIITAIGTILHAVAGAIESFNKPV